MLNDHSIGHSTQFLVELVTLHLRLLIVELLNSKCLPTLLYGLEACPLKSADLKDSQVNDDPRTARLVPLLSSVWLLQASHTGESGRVQATDKVPLRITKMMNDRFLVPAYPDCPERVALRSRNASCLSVVNFNSTLQYNVERKLLLLVTSVSDIRGVYSDTTQLNSTRRRVVDTFTA